MTADEVLVELFERLASVRGSSVVISSRELANWPANIVSAMKKQGLLSQARPAKSTICPDCERECLMPLHFMSNSAGHSQALIVCDKRDDVNRVLVTLDSLEQWQTSADALTDMLAQLSGLRGSGVTNSEAFRWEVGLLKGAKHASHLVLKIDGGLILSLAGHTVPLDEVLTFDGKLFKVDKRKLTRLADQPALGGGDVESAEQRRQRLKKRVQEVKDQGNRAFLKTVAAEEVISIPRLKQLLHEENEPKKSKPNW